MTTSQTPSPDSVVVAVETVLSAPLGGEVVLLEPEAGIYYSLNQVGTRVWDLIQDPARVEDICARIVEEFEVDLDTCRRDVLHLLGEMGERGLIETRPPAP